MQNIPWEQRELIHGFPLGQQAVRAILFTASQFPGVKKVELKVEGENYSPAPETATTFLNDATEVMTQYPGVVEID